MTLVDDNDGSTKPFVYDIFKETFELIASLMESFSSSIDKYVLPNSDLMCICMRLVERHLMFLVQHCISYLFVEEEISRIRKVILTVLDSDPCESFIILSCKLFEIALEVLFPTINLRRKLLWTVFEKNTYPVPVKCSILSGFCSLPFISYYVVSPSEKEQSDRRLSQMIDNVCSGESLSFLEQVCMIAFDVGSDSDLHPKNSLDQWFMMTCNDFLARTCRDFCGRLKSDLKKVVVTDEFPLISIFLKICHLLIKNCSRLLQDSKVSKRCLEQTPLYHCLGYMITTLFELSFSYTPSLAKTFSEISNDAIHLSDLLLKISNSTITTSTLCVPRNDSYSGPLLIGTKSIENHDGEGNVIHPYNNDQDYTDSCVFAGAEYLMLEFDAQCATERRYDSLTISRRPNQQDVVGTYSGTRANDWPDTPIKVLGDSIYMKFKTDGSNTEWGYKFTVKAFGTGLDPFPKFDWLVDLSSLLGSLIGKLGFNLIVSDCSMVSHSVFNCDMVKLVQGKDSSEVKELVSKYDRKSFIQIFEKKERNQLIKFPGELVADLFEILLKKLNSTVLDDLLKKNPVFSKFIPKNLKLSSNLDLLPLSLFLVFIASFDISFDADSSYQTFNFFLERFKKLIDADKSSSLSQVTYNVVFLILSWNSMVPFSDLMVDYLLGFIFSNNFDLFHVNFSTPTLLSRRSGIQIFSHLLKNGNSLARSCGFSLFPKSLCFLSEAKNSTYSIYEPVFFSCPKVPFTTIFTNVSEVELHELSESFFELLLLDIPSRIYQLLELLPSTDSAIVEISTLLSCYCFALSPQDFETLHELVLNLVVGVQEVVNPLKESHSVAESPP
ncbi:hypothetical protein GEMRC1_007596 [Eukaryota sp. GEM-RC1]